MTSNTTTVIAPTTGSTTVANRMPPLGDLRLSFGGLVKSEFIKLRSQRSSYWLIAIIAVDMISAAITIALGVGLESDATPTTATALTLADTATSGTMIAQFAAIFFGVFAITGEYRTGQIRNTFGADPSRVRALAAKAVIVAATTFAVTLVSSIVALIIAVVAALVSGAGIDLSGFDAEAIRVVVGGSAFVALVGVLSLAFGALLKKSTPAVFAVLVLLWALPGTAVLFEGGPVGVAASYLPSAVGSAMYSSTAGAADSVFGAISPESTVAMPPWLGLLLFIAYVAVFSLCGLAAARRRDV